MRTILPYAAALALLLPAAGWAQQPSGPQQGGQQPGGQQPGPQPGPGGEPIAPEVTVQQPAPDVTVRQEAPDVTVRRARPDVNLDVGRAQVDIETAQPQVDVQAATGEVQAEINRAQPNVDIRQAKPNVDIQMAEPEIIVERAEAPANISVQKLNREQANLQDVGIQRREDIVGMNVVDREGEEVGTISDLMTQDGRIHAAVVSMEGGLLGGNEKMVSVPWNAVQVDQENQRLSLRMSEDELDNMPEFAYDEQSQQQALVGPQGQQGQQDQQTQR